jgi:hypothetical protein
MTDKPSKEISRRDAIKILAAAVGASVLANLPSKWSTPELASGVLPVHAQTSSILHTLLCDPDENVGEPDSNQYASGVTINPPDAGIVMRWNMTLNNVVLDNPADPTTGTELTDGAGHAAVTTPPVTIVNINLDASVTVTWSFENPLDGSDSCDQVFTYLVPIIT